MTRLMQTLTLGAVAFLSACSADTPTAADAIAYLTKRVGDYTWENATVTNCAGNDGATTCVVSYTRSLGPYRQYEELQMRFVKTPSGWTPQGYDVLLKKRL